MSSVPAFAQPVINSFSPLAAPVGSTVIITGNNFSSTPANNIVYFGPVKAAISAATSTSLTVTVPAEATYNYITVTTNNFTAYSLQPFIVISGSQLTTSSFSLRIPFSVTGDYPTGLAVSDLDGDGKPDLIATNFNSGNLSIFKNASASGTVQMQPEIKLQVHSNPEGLAVGDLNDDGKPDLAVPSINDHIISVFINTSSAGTISFANSIDIYQGTTGWSRGLAIGDVDNDGKPDIVAADNNKIIDWTNNTSYGTVSVYRNTGSAGSVSFASPVVFKTADYPRRVAIADIDGDGKPDVAATNNNAGSVSVLRNTCSPGTIAFSANQDYVTGSYPDMVLFGDLNGDGKADMVVSNYVSATISVFKNMSVGGSITFASKQDIAVNMPLGIALGDVTGDGKPDLVSTAFSSSMVSIFQNTSSGANISFAPKMDYSSGNTPLMLAIDDIDGDNLPDIAVTNGSINTVSVLKMAGGLLPTVNLGNDTTLCQGDSLVLTANVANAQYLWSTGAATQSITVKQTGSYWVKVTVLGNSAADTIQVTFNAPPVFDLGSDTSLCEGQKLILKPVITGSSYLWQNGSHADSMVVTQPGTYWLQVKKNVCTAADTINVSYKPLPLVNLGNDTAICKGTSVLLDASALNATYVWSTGANTATIDVTNEGLYWVAVTSDGCIAKDSIQISYLVLPQSPLGNDTTLCDGLTLLLKPDASNASFVWQDGSTAPTFTVTQPGKYSVTITNKCESVTDEIIVKRGLCQLFMPNAFTPNHDGINDVFRVKDPAFIKTFDMQIFNRWGQLVYSSKDPYKGWDGYFNGSKQPEGNYVWTILLTDIEGNTKRFKGFVVLID